MKEGFFGFAARQRFFIVRVWGNGPVVRSTPPV
jgi:hypothetical protein